jgi:hypothetical protein
MKVTVVIENLRVEMNDKVYQISVKDGTIMVYSDDGVEVQDKSQLGKWLIIK